MQRVLPEKPVVSVLVIAVSTPLLVGVYAGKDLIYSIKSEEKTSIALPKILDDLLKTYKIESLFYAKGPGSFMAIRIAYVILKTLSISLNIPFLASDAFAFNKNHPIKAVAKSFFVKKNGEIIVKRYSVIQMEEFNLPKSLDLSVFEEKNSPLYVLPAI